MTDDQDHDERDEDTRGLTAAVQQLIESQDRKHEVRQAELQVQGKEIESNERIAMASIEAQSRFHSQRFTRYNAHLIHRYIFIGVISTFFSALLWVLSIWMTEIW